MQINSLIKEQTYPTHPILNFIPYQLFELRHNALHPGKIFFSF